MDLDRATACTCGEVIFDLSERTVGDLLQCPWCAKQFRFAGVGVLEPVRLVPGRARKVKRRAPRPGIPGGAVVMLLFLVGCNALAFGAVEVLLPKDVFGVRHLLWNAAVVLPKDSWWFAPATIVAGHLLGFTAWVTYLYRLHRRGKLNRS